MVVILVVVSSCLYMNTRKTNALKGKIMRDRDANLGQHKTYLCYARPLW